MHIILMLKSAIISLLLIASVILLVRQRKVPNKNMRIASIALFCIAALLSAITSVNSRVAYYNPSEFQQFTGGKSIAYTVDGSSSKLVVINDVTLGTIPLDSAESEVINLRKLYSKRIAFKKFAGNGTSAMIDVYQSADKTDFFVRIIGFFDTSIEISDNCGSVFSEETTELLQDSDGEQFISGDFVACVPDFDENYQLTINGEIITFNN